MAGMFDDLIPQKTQTGGLSFDDLIPASGADQGISAMLPSVSTDTTAQRAQREFEALPTWKKPLVAADDLVTQFASGLTMGLAEKGVANINASLRGTDYETERGKIDKMLQESRARSGIPGMIANVGGAVVGPAKLAGAGITATKVPYLGKSLGLAADAAAIGGVTAYGNDMPIGQGAAIGAGAGLAGQALVSGLSKAITPFRAPPARVAAAEALKREGINVSAGQKTGNKALLTRESEIGGDRMRDFAEQQGEQLTAAALRKVGEKTATRLTPDVVESSFKRIGKQFDELSVRNAMLPDQRVVQDLSDTALQYASVVAPSSRIPFIENTTKDVLTLLQSGRMDGKVYKSLRSQIDRFARGATQPEAKMAARELINALDSGMERSILRINPKDAGKWSQARRQYRNMIVLEQASTAAGSTAREGILSPSALRAATVQKHGRRNFAKGQGDFADLARNAEMVMTKIPDSGTASRLAARGLPQFAGAITGAGIGGYQGGDWQGAAMGAAAGLAAPHLAGRIMTSGPGQRYLGNQALANVSPEVQDAIARALAMMGTTGIVGAQ